MGINVKKIITGLLICVPLSLPAQQKQGQPLIDSLLRELPKQKEDTNKVNVLCKLASENREINPDEGMRYGNLGLILAERLGFRKGLSAAHYVIGTVYTTQGNLPEALKSQSAALKLAEEMNDKSRLGECYNQIGVIHYLQGNYPEAYKDYFSGLKLMEETGDREQEISVCSNIANIYNVQNFHQDALKYYNKAIEIAQEIGQKKMKAKCLANIAVMNSNEGNYQEALKKNSKAIKICQEINEKYDLANCYNIAGHIYCNQKNYPEALKYLFASMNILEGSHLNWGLMSAQSGIGDIFYGQKKYREAEKYYNEALRLAEKSGTLPIIKRVNECLSTMYVEIGQYKKALIAYKSFKSAGDSIYNVKNEKKIVQTQMQYEFDKKESMAALERAKKDAALKLQLQRKNVFIYGSFSAFIGFLLIGTLLIRQGKLKANHQRIELEQKQLRAQMNPHFIFNCLNSIQHFVVANDVKNANKYLSGFASLMRQTLENSRESTITLRRELTYLESYLSLELMRFEDKFTYEITCAENVNMDTVEIPSMIIQPFIENAIRHGLCYLKDKEGKLIIHFYLKEGYLFCEIDDNGIGREQSHKLKMDSEMVYESQGMELTRQRLALVSKSYGSDFELEVKDKKNADSESEGTTIIIKFPVNT
jgi:tetratricopeptide (TPR) repeat protein